jgi:hypothetical protein
MWQRLLIGMPRRSHGAIAAWIGLTSFHLRPGWPYVFPAPINLHSLSRMQRALAGFAVTPAAADWGAEPSRSKCAPGDRLPPFDGAERRSDSTGQR